MAPTQPGRGHYISEEEETGRSYLVTVTEPVSFASTVTHSKVSLKSSLPSCEQNKHEQPGGMSGGIVNSRPTPLITALARLRAPECLVQGHRLPSTAAIPLLSE